MARKLYYKIGEACKLLDIQPYVLRYWETEFPVLSPSKSKSGQRVYNERDLEMIQRIKELLYDEGYTIAGAKKKLEGEEDSRATDEKAEEKPPAKTAAPARKAAAPKKAPAKKAPAAKKTAKKAPAGGDEKARVRELEQAARKALKEARALLEYLDS